MKKRIPYLWTCLKSFFGKVKDFFTPTTMIVELSADDLKALENELIALRSMLDTIATGNEASFDNMCRLIDNGLYEPQFGRNPAAANQILSAVSSRKADLASSGHEWKPGKRDEELKKMFGNHGS